MPRIRPFLTSWLCRSTWHDVPVSESVTPWRNMKYRVPCVPCSKPHPNRRHNHHRRGDDSGDDDGGDGGDDDDEGNVGRGHHGHDRDRDHDHIHPRGSGLAPSHRPDIHHSPRNVCMSVNSLKVGQEDR